MDHGLTETFAGKAWHGWHWLMMSAMGIMAIGNASDVGGAWGFIGSVVLNFFIDPLTMGLGHLPGAIGNLSDTFSGAVGVAEAASSFGLDHAM